MFSPARRRCLRAATCAPSETTSILSFLLPAFHQPSNGRRTFSSTPKPQSKIGAAPLSIPPEVTFELLPYKAKRGAVMRSQPMSTAHIKGPLGEMKMDIPPYIAIDTSSGSPKLNLVEMKDRKQKAMWGTTRAYLQNHILGVSEGHSAILRMVGVGYRATVENTAVTVQPSFPGQKFVNLKVGYSHPVELPIPEGVKASTPQPTRILLEGVEKEVVMQFAAKIRKWRVPEPYKGKGIFVNGETIKLKNKKIK